MKTELETLLTAIEQRAEKATLGEWKRNGQEIAVLGRGKIAIIPTPQNNGTYDCNANADFIAAARSDVPALIRVVEHYRSKLKNCVTVTAALARWDMEAAIILKGEKP